MMLATLYFSDPQTGVVFSARVAEVDAGGRLTDPVLIEALRAGGWGWKMVRDNGYGAQVWRDRTGGFGWGGTRRNVFK